MVLKRVLVATEEAGMGKKDDVKEGMNRLIRMK